MIVTGHAVGNDLFGDRVLNISLHSAFQRSGSIAWVITGVGYKSLCRRCDIEIESGFAHAVLESFEFNIDDLLDIVLLPHTKPFDKDLFAKKIGTLEIVCCVSRESALSECKEVTANTLKEQPLVLFSESFFQTKAIKNWFAEAGVLPKVSVQTEQITTCISMIENDLAVGFAFRRFAERNDALVSRPLSPPISVDVSVLRKKDIYATEGIKKLERFLVESNLLG